MRARAWLAATMLVATVASADPKPTAVDIKAYKDKLIVLRDASGGTYVVDWEREGDSHVFYGTGKTLYEQISIGKSANGDAWDIRVLAPRVEETRNGSVGYKQDHTYSLWCGMVETGLTQITGDKAKAVLDKYQFMTTALVRKPHILARDDHGMYYYVDRLREGKGFRMFVGRKGAMKELPIIDISSDAAGEVFATKSGDLRITNRRGDSADALWSRGDKKEALIALDEFVNSPVIYGQLGIYQFTGTVCETYEPR